MSVKRPQPKGGSRKGIPNKVTADLKTMIMGALSDVGGRQYLAGQALTSPAAFMVLVGKVLPLQVGGDPEGVPVRMSIEQQQAEAVKAIAESFAEPARED